MESWRKVWREGFAPLLPTAGLEALATALEADDARLIQGITTDPPPLQCVADWLIEGVCATGFCGWQDGTGKTTVADVEEFFAQTCFKADQALGEPAAVRWFLNQYDDWPRSEMVKNLLPEVKRVLDQRKIANKTTG